MPTCWLPYLTGNRLRVEGEQYLTVTLMPMYEESAGIPLIISGSGVARASTCTTPASLVDAFPSILQAMGADSLHEDFPGGSWYEMAASKTVAERPVFSEYHAMESPSALFMLRTGRWKLHHYFGFEPELFDLEEDPGELKNLASSPAHARILQDCEVKLREFVDPKETDARCKADQKAFVEKLGGPQHVLNACSGGKNYTEVPAEFMAGG